MPTSNFTQLVQYVFFDAVPLAIFSAMVGLIIWGTRYTKRHPGEKPPLRTAIPLALLLAYMAGLFSITTLGRTRGDPDIQWHLFRAFWEAWNNFNFHYWTLYLGNIAMFMPLGIFFPLIAPVFRRWYVTIPIGFVTSLVIEGTQFLLVRGTADVDDMFCNTLGAALGYCLCMTVLSLIEKKARWSIAYGVVPLMFAAAVSGIFVTYYTQPYGNLMEGPSFVADTSGVEWVLDCALSDEPGEVGICHADPYTLDECLEFAEAMIEDKGLALIRTENYDEVMYYEANAQNPEDYGKQVIFLWVTPADRSFDYTGWIYKDTYDILDYHETELWDNGQMTADYLRSALLEYGVYIPEKATMTYDGDRGWKGWYTFDANQIHEGDYLIDGSLRCQVMVGGEIICIENSMTQLVWQADEPIISEVEAYERLRQGRFSHGYFFEGVDPSEVRVWSCTLDYVADTKGFRQPVYWFELEGMNSVFVPALRDYWGP